MAKRILAMLLVMAMVFSVLPTGVFAEGEGQQTPTGEPASRALKTHADSGHKCEHCDKVVTWTPWGGTGEKNKLPTSGHYYLVDNIDLKSQTAVYGDLVLCLNGYNVIASANVHVFRTAASGKVTITDCTAETVEENGQQVYKAGKITPYNGGYTFMMTTDKTNGKEVASNAVVNLYDGIICNAYSTSASGTVVNMKSNAVFNMHGGEISNNRGASGCIYMAGSASFNVYGGTIKKNVATNGGVFYMAAANTKLKIENADLIENSATSGGGVVYVNGGTATITDSVLHKNAATSSGGTVYLKTGTVTLDGAQITESHAGGLAGSIRADGGTLTLKDTSITDGTMGSYGDAAMGHVYMTNLVTFTVKGNTRIIDNEDSKGNPANLFMFASQVTTSNLSMIRMDPQDPLKDDAKIGISMNANRWNSTAGGRIISVALGMDAAQGEAVTKYFASDNSGREVSYNASQDKLELVVASDHPHNVCNNAGCQDGHGNVKFMRWGDKAEEKTKLPTSGCYYLTSDIDLQTATNVYGELVLCLNGHNIVASKNVSVFRTAASAKITVTDCQAKTVEENGQQVYKAGRITPYNGGYTVMMATDKTNGVEVASDAVFNMYGGIITGATTSAGSAVHMKSNTVFNMYGGEISNNAGGSSGPIYVSGNAKFNAYGGSIQNNSGTNGGAFKVTGTGAELTVDGANIENNTATGSGGAIIAESGAKVNIISGKITDNESPNGGAIYMSRKTTLTMTGGEISNNKSTGSGGAVYHLESTGIYSGGTISDNKAVGSGAAIFNNGGNVTLSGATVSGNDAGNLGGAVYGNKNSKTTVQDGQISGNKAKNSGGAIYAGEGALVELKGGKLTKNEAGNGGGIYATDAGTVVNMNGGEVSENEASSGGGMLIASGTVLNLTAGKISGNKASSGAGLYMSKKSTVNMTGGEISGNIATGSGAGIYHLESTGNYTGGSITGNISGYNGGAMFLNVATVKLGSVSITGNEAAASAGGIYPHGATDLTVTGDAVVQDNTANGKKNNVYLPGTLSFKVDNVGQNAKVGLSAATAFRFVSTANDTDYSKNFTSDRASLQVEYRGQQLYLGASGNHAHCLCDSNITYCDHGEVLFAAWDDPYSLPSNGNWYLNTDVTLSGSVDMRDVTLNLCLNGHTIKQTGKDKMIFDVKGATNLNITDCTDKPGTITGATKSAIFGNNNSTAVINLYNGIITGNSGTNAGAVFLQSNQVFNMYGGKIEGNQNASTAAAAGAISAYYGNVQVNIYGGEISGNKSTYVVSEKADGTKEYFGGNAGAIYAEGNSVKINLHGGTISGNHADAAGGAVYAVKGAEINLLGAKLTGNTAGNKSGAIYATGAAKVNMAAGELSENSAPNGGAILVESGAVVNMTGGKITGNKADDGAGIYMTTRTVLNMTGGELSGNIAKGNGGALALLRCEATVSGGTISENSAMYGGGILVRGCELQLKGGQIIKNVATNNGGGIKTGNQTAGDKVYTAKIVMTDGLISENKANNGGAIIVEGAGCEMLLQGGEISKNTATWGGGLFVSTKTSFTMEGGKIADNAAVKTGGGIQMLNSTATFTGGEISGNQCPSTGGGIYVNEKDSVATFDGTTFKNNKGGYGGAVCAANRGKVILKSGTFTKNTAVNNGGGLYISTNCVFDMYGGTITGNNVEKDTGGGLYGLRSTMNLYGGTVSYNTSKIGGGGIMVAAGTLNLMGTSVLYNTAVSGEAGTGGTGGGIRTNCQTVTQNGVTTKYVAKINMTGGIVKGNKAGYAGGGVLVNGVGATMKISGGTICDNVSNSLGGGLYVSNQTVFEMTGGEVSRNEAPKEGGGIWLAKNNEFAISNVKFTENFCGKNGGAVYMHNNCKCTFTNVEFSKNVAQNCGGAIFTVQDCNAIMKGCTFTENRSIDLSGGAVFLRYIGTVEDCVFTGNKSGANAGALYIGQSSLSVNGFGNKTRRMSGITVSGSTFENNEAPALGGAIYIMMSGYTDMKECTFKGNTAGELGTAIWAEEDLSMENVTITGNKGKDGTYAVYLAPSNYDGQSYFKGTMKMFGDMIISDNEGGDLYLAEGVAVGTTAKGYGQKTKIGVTLDSGVLTQRVYGAYNYEGGNCVYTITYGDRSLTDPEIDASLLAVAQDDAVNAMNIWLYAGVGVFVLAIAAVVIAVVAGKKKKAAKEAVEE